MPYKAVFFDFDGTLMDTREGVIAGGKHAMEELGLDIPQMSDWNRFIGPPLSECFRTLFGIDDESTVARLVEEYRNYYNAKGYTQAAFYPGILELIERLKAEGRIVVCTTLKTHFLANKMLSYFGVPNLFDALYGMNLEETSTKASLCEEAMKRFGLKPEECVLVGDTKFDREGAAKAGIDFVAVDWGFGFRKSDGAVSTMDELYTRL